MDWVKYQKFKKMFLIGLITLITICGVAFEIFLFNCIGGK